MPITEQCIFSSGRLPRYLAMSSLVTFSASDTALPLTNSVSADALAIALAQPKVWNFTSAMRVFPASSFRKSFSASPQLMFPTSPMASASAISPTFLGWRKWSMTFSV